MRAGRNVTRGAGYTQADVESHRGEMRGGGRPTAPEQGRRHVRTFVCCGERRMPAKAEHTETATKCRSVYCRTEVVGGSLAVVFSIEPWGRGPSANDGRTTPLPDPTTNKATYRDKQRDPAIAMSRQVLAPPGGRLLNSPSLGHSSSVRSWLAVSSPGHIFESCRWSASTDLSAPRQRPLLRLSLYGCLG